MTGENVALIVVEAENPSDPLTLLRVRTPSGVRGEGLTAAQTHVLIGELLQSLFSPSEIE